ncbi:putative DNA-directed RNA polymerase I subunit RPA2 [Neolecta irregularis DAH-3]|uniref:DNA-directed RNA polymerase n=1 Tax=Neolecta irregularis (strain DAH-3) TaxID=1198029 RepID=A0A1U7LLQ8_NEOID|nr:putative DNA-directed RNA polymerase I subunit RPA2 [Neolecta irregularis DAH-3]|eukprot:OLL23594.1 putative DNA-directed RNA polymerase I subunit RPA2 [Neolecta irregularis DAH-3]
MVRARMIYRLQTVQAPIVHQKLHDISGFDHYPNVTNAIVAVVDYTRYDMDDAMILNKSAHERDTAHCTSPTSSIVLKMGRELSIAVSEQTALNAGDRGWTGTGTLCSELNSPAVTQLLGCSIET